MKRAKQLTKKERRAAYLMAGLTTEPASAPACAACQSTSLVLTNVEHSIFPDMALAACADCGAHNWTPKDHPGFAVLAKESILKREVDELAGHVEKAIGEPAGTLIAVAWLVEMRKRGWLDGGAPQGTDVRLACRDWWAARNRAAFV
jgi:hypothetical protein